MVLVLVPEQHKADPPSGLSQSSAHISFLAGPQGELSNPLSLPLEFPHSPGPCPSLPPQNLFSLLHRWGHSLSPRELHGLLSLPGHPFKPLSTDASLVSGNTGSQEIWVERQEAGARDRSGKASEPQAELGPIIHRQAQS